MVHADSSSVTLADALGSVDVLLRPGSAGHQTAFDPSPGDFMVVEGTWESGRVRDAEVQNVFSYPTPHPRSDAARFTNGGVAAHLLARSMAVKAVRRLLDDDGFLEVETPSWTPCPNLDPNLDVVPVGDETGASGYLITSPEHHMKRMLSGGFQRIYQFARCTRGNERGPWHEPEFTLLEWYRAFEQMGDVMADTEAIVCEIAQAAGDGALHAPDGRVIPLRRPFPRVSVQELFREHAETQDGVGLAAEDEQEYFQRWVDHIEPALCRYETPVFVWKYPACHAALARLDPTDARVAERFELYAGGVELCNGYGELTDEHEQRARFMNFRAQRAGQPLEHAPLDERFLSALKTGMPPAAGNALGVDRVLALSRSVKTIADVQAFPASIK